MTAATIAFVTAVLVLLGGLWLAMRWAERRADDDYMGRVLDDAEFAITRDDRVALDAEAVTFASVGWDMPDYAEHQRAAKATMEAYDLEQEMLRDLDEAIAIVEEWSA